MSKAECPRLRIVQRSRALALYRTLTDEIGARLTGSPAHRQAARWARDRFAEWGLADAHLEPYEFGRGWSLDRISVEMTTPRCPLIAYADAWSPSTAGVVSGRVVYVGDKTASQSRRWRDSFKDFDGYHERTRHTNADYPERMSEDELKQSAIVMATFAWQAAVRDEKIPRMPAR
jgi:hypothetical protein